jgi:hypothetical protein
MQELSDVRRVWRYQKGNQNPYIEEEQTTQWPKEKVQKDKQRSTKHTHKTKDRVTRTPIETRCELRCSGRVSISCSTSGTRRVTNVVRYRWNHVASLLSVAVSMLLLHVNSLLFFMWLLHVNCFVVFYVIATRELFCCFLCDCYTWIVFVVFSKQIQRIICSSSDTIITSWSFNWITCWLET